jgi:hypothetical protein
MSDKRLNLGRFVDWTRPLSFNVSVLLPTRGRTDALMRSVKSLLDLADVPMGIEILYGLDDDDTAALEYIQGTIAPALQDQDHNNKILVFKRMGYANLNQYVNQLAKHASGRWLMFWNDDAIMQTQGWDQRIVEHDGDFAVLRMPTHNQHPYAIFPIVPMEWYRLMGYLSPHQISDAWISQTAYMLGIMRNIDVSVLHDRHDLTGNNHDSTYQERIMFEGRPEDPRDFNHIDWRVRRVSDTIKLAWYMQQRGQDVSWFKNVMAGQQDPWAWMCGREQDPNGQLSQYKDA